MKDEKIKDVVRATYSQIAERSQQSCCSGCGCGVSPSAQAEAVGYLKEDLENVPEGAAMGLGCGNPIAIAELREGETVLDLGAGAGMDVFLAANKVGAKGRVIGVDMTREMIDRASAIAKSNGYENVEFRLGEIEKLPVDDGSMDTVISNCVINLSPDKSRVFSEAYRVLKPRGKLIVSDIVSEHQLPDGIREDPNAWAGCIAGALEQQEYLAKIREAGFRDLQLVPNGEFYAEDVKSSEVVKLLSISVKAYKP
jgi:SAM-dependent methyltransferase